MRPHPVAVAHGDTGGLLTAVLQGEQAEERELGDAFSVRSTDTEHTALLAGSVVVFTAGGTAWGAYVGGDGDAALHEGSSEVARVSLAGAA